MSLFSFHRDNVHTVIHVSSVGISVMLVHTTNNHIISYEYQSFNMFIHDTRSQYEQLLIQARLVINRIIHTTPTYNSNHATIILGEPWAHTVRRQIIYRRKTPFKLTKTFVRDLVARDQKKMTHELLSSSQDVAGQILDPYYHDLFIAGHSTTNPWGKTINDITIDYSTGFSDMQIINIIKSTIHEKLHIPLLHIKIDHFQNILARFLKKTSLDQALVIDWFGQTTDLYIIQNKSLVQTGTLPMGSELLKYQMALSLGIYPRELKSLLSLYDRQLLSLKMVTRIEKIMTDLFMVWEKDFQLFCNKAVAAGDTINNIVWLDNHDPFSTFFMNMLLQDQVTHPIIFGSTHVNGISLESFSQFKLENHIVMQIQDKIIHSELS